MTLTTSTRTHPSVSLHDTDLWTEKYRPKDVSDLVGNPGVIEKMRNWLSDWEDVHIRGNKKPYKFRPGAPNDNPNLKAIMLSGPPGIGKTTTCKILAERCGYEVLEFNASDNRGKNFVEELSSGASSNTQIQYMLKNKQERQSTFHKKKVCFIFDECDGLSAGDRGGANAMIQLIKKSLSPVICICNDRMNTKIRSLNNHCYDLRFIRPTKQQMAKRLTYILNKEGLKNVNMNNIELLCESARGDIRQVINALQLNLSNTNAATNQNSINKESLEMIHKDTILSLSNFDAATKLLNNKANTDMTLNEKMELFFVDFDMVPLLVQENYLDATSSNNNDINKCVLASENIALSDVLNKSIRMNQNWSLLPSYGLLSSILPCENINHGIGRVNFTSLLGRQSTRGKNQRLLQELHSQIRINTTLSTNSIRNTSYIETLYNRCLYPLYDTNNYLASSFSNMAEKEYNEKRQLELANAATNAQNTKGGKKSAAKKNDLPIHIRDVMSFLDSYKISKTLILENCKELKIKGDADCFANVDTKTKSAFTRAYNSSAHSIQILDQEKSIKKMRKGPGLDGSEKGEGESIDSSMEDEDMENDNSLLF